MAIYGFWQDAEEDARLTAFAEQAREYARPLADYSRHIYGEETYRQLQRVKQHYDPGNLFRVNYNVRPEG